MKLKIDEIESLVPIVLNNTEDQFEFIDQYVKMTFDPESNLNPRETAKFINLYLSAGTENVARLNARIKNIICSENNPQGDQLQFVVDLFKHINLFDMRYTSFVPDVLQHLAKDAFYSEFHSALAKSHKVPPSDMTKSEKKLLGYIALFRPHLIANIPNAEIFSFLHLITLQSKLKSDDADIYLKFIKQCQTQRGNDPVISEALTSCLLACAPNCALNDVLLNAYLDCISEENEFKHAIDLFSASLKVNYQSIEKNYSKIFFAILNRSQGTFEQLFSAFQLATEGIPGQEKANFIWVFILTILRAFQDSILAINTPCARMLIAWHKSLIEKKVLVGTVEQMKDMLSLFIDLLKAQEKPIDTHRFESPLWEKYAPELIKTVEDMSFFEKSVTKTKPLQFAFTLLSNLKENSQLGARKKTTAKAIIEQHSVEMLLAEASHHCSQLYTYPHKKAFSKNIAKLIFEHAQKVNTVNAVDLLTYILKQDDYKSNYVYAALSRLLISKLYFFNSQRLAIVAANLKNDKNRIIENLPDSLVYMQKNIVDSFDLGFPQYLEALLSYDDADGDSFGSSTQSQYQKPLLNEHWGLAITQPIWEVTKQLAKPITVKSFGSLLLQPFRGIKNVFKGAIMLLAESPIVFIGGLITAAFHPSLGVDFNESHNNREKKNRIRKEACHRSGQLVISGSIRVSVGVFQTATFLVFVPTALVIRSIMRIVKGKPHNLKTRKVKAAIKATKRLIDDTPRDPNLKPSKKQEALNEVTYQLEKATRKGLIKKDDFKELGRVIN